MSRIKEHEPVYLVRETKMDILALIRFCNSLKEKEG